MAEDNIIKVPGYISYARLYSRLNRMGLTTDDLINNGLPPIAIEKMRNFEPIGTNVIAWICWQLTCQPGDIMRFVRSDDNGKIP